MVLLMSLKELLTYASFLLKILNAFMIFHMSSKVMQAQLPWSFKSKLTNNKYNKCV